MKIFTRHDLVAPDLGDEPALLLEGSWPAEPCSRPRWSLDEAIDARFGWIDLAASDLAERAAGTKGRSEPRACEETTFAYLNALALRYYVVKLLRVVAFFDEVKRPEPGEELELVGTRGLDEAYVDLAAEVCRSWGLRLRTFWSEGRRAPRRMEPDGSLWRRWAARAGACIKANLTPSRGERPTVVLCGNPRLLDPVCAELLRRGCRVGWLHERFAYRSWWRWARADVEQLVCDEHRGRQLRFSDAWPAGDLVYRGVDLAPALARWLAERAAQLGGRQSRLVEQIDVHFQHLRPRGVVLDEDATPLKRAAIALARRHGAASLVVQHGAPCVRFGFAPLAADRIAVWGASSRDQLLRWGISPERIEVTGWPALEGQAGRRGWSQRSMSGKRRANRPTSRSGQAGGRAGCAQGAAPRPARSKAPRILLMAMVPPKDDRPDAVTFHLTRQTHDELVRMACAAVAKIGGARLIVKLHPRSVHEGPIRRAVARFPQVRGRVVRSASLASLLERSACVLSCASTAGIEAALAGAAVIQLLPAGSGDILPAAEWGLLGTARDEAQLVALLAQALGAGSLRTDRTNPQALYRRGRPAAQQVVDALLECRQARPPSQEAGFVPLSTARRLAAGSCEPSEV